jgi:hypothetical protein
MLLFNQRKDNSMKTAEKTVPYLVKDNAGDIETVKAKYSGAIPPKVFAGFTRHVRSLAARGVFFPADPLDVYHEAYSILERCAANLSKDVHSKDAYLRNAARLAVLKARERITKRMRDEYRAIEGVKRPAELLTEACDQELDGSCSDEERVSYDANDLAEMLVAAPDPMHVRRLVRQCLERTFRKLNPKTVRAFRAWIAAEGVVKEAARLCGESRFAFHRQWDRRKAEFRAACDWVEADIF